MVTPEVCEKCGVQRTKAAPYCIKCGRKWTGDAAPWKEYERLERDRERRDRDRERDRGRLEREDERRRERVQKELDQQERQTRVDQLPKWDYLELKVMTGGVHTPRIEAQKQIAALGDKGWELVAVVPVARGGGMVEQVFFYFKRPRV
jgi:hypothetical protein